MRFLFLSLKIFTAPEDERRREMRVVATVAAGAVAPVRIDAAKAILLYASLGVARECLVLRLR